MVAAAPVRTACGRHCAAVAARPAVPGSAGLPARPKLLSDGRGDLIVPAWQPWGGLNDRFAFCSVRAAHICATRGRLLAASCQDMRAVHAEQFLRYVVACHGLRVGLTDLRAVRVRANGRIPE